MTRCSMTFAVVMFLATQTVHAQSQQPLPCSQPNSPPATCAIVTPIDALTALTYRPELAGRSFAFGLAQVLRSELATFPLDSSSERPVTNGGRKLNVTVLFQHTSFNSVSGIPVDRLEIGGDFPRRASIHLSSDRTIIGMSYGVTSKVDIGLVVPFGRTEVSGVSSMTVFVPGGGRRVISDQADESPFGIGDIVVRSKWKFVSSPPIDLAGGIDLRLPTGSKQHLLGLGRTQTKLMLLGASMLGRLAPHFNVGYTFGGPGISPDLRTARTGLSDLVQPSNEINYMVGADVPVTRALTLVGDLVGRRLERSAAVRFRPFRSGPSGIYEIIPQSVNGLLGTVGTKANVAGSWLITASILFPLNDGAVRPRTTAVVGLQRGF